MRSTRYSSVMAATARLLLVFMLPIFSGCVTLGGGWDLCASPQRPSYQHPAAPLEPAAQLRRYAQRSAAGSVERQPRAIGERDFEPFALGLEVSNAY